VGGKHVGCRCILNGPGPWVEGGWLGRDRLRRRFHHRGFLIRFIEIVEPDDFVVGVIFVDLEQFDVLIFAGRGSFR
jgi:hypothetical protein